MKRLEDFPWPKDVFRLEELIPELKPKIVIWRLISAVTPAWLLSHLLGLPARRPERGGPALHKRSSGEPKGVVLSHRNVLGNVQQFSSMLNLGPRRFGDGFAAVLSQLRLHRDAVVSDDCRGTRCHLPNSGRCGEKR